MSILGEITNRCLCLLFLCPSLIYFYFYFHFIRVVESVKHFGQCKLF